jgi:glycopeptide antibiotics resistance protein
MSITGNSRARLHVAGGILVAYAIAVLVVTLWPAPVDRGFEPTISRGLALLHRNGLPIWFGYNKLEFAANIVMFVPAGFLVSMLLPARRWYLALLVVPALSICIELTQAIFLSSRFATVNDVIANSLGAAIGIFTVFLVRTRTSARYSSVARAR